MTYKFFRCYSTAFLGFLLLLSILSLQLQLGHPTSKSPYDSGYDHGCDDADMSDSTDRYINQPEKGPSFHTDAFMNGYQKGFDNCSKENDEKAGELEEQQEQEQEEKGNDPCISNGQNICDSSGECDTYNFDYLDEQCNDGMPGTTGQCEGDDEPNLPQCDGSYQDCITHRGDVCVAGSTEHKCEIE